MGFVEEKYLYFYAKIIHVPMVISSMNVISSNRSSSKIEAAPTIYQWHQKNVPYAKLFYQPISPRSIAIVESKQSAHMI